MPHHTAKFYLSGLYAGTCSVPYFPMKPGDFPCSHHYIDPLGGTIWASVEVLGSRWTAFTMPSLNNLDPEYERWPRGLRLDWLFGRGFYDDERLHNLPPQVLSHELRAHFYNLDKGLPL